MMRSEISSIFVAVTRDLGRRDPKSRFDGDLAARAANRRRARSLPLAGRRPMSFDPRPIALFDARARVVRGIVAGRGHPPLVWKFLNPAQRFELTFLAGMHNNR